MHASMGAPLDCGSDRLQANKPRRTLGLLHTTDQLPFTLDRRRLV